MKEIEFRCSSLGKLATEPRETHPKLKIPTEETRLEKKKFEYSELKNKETLKAKKLVQDITKIEAYISELEILATKPHLSETCKKECIRAYAWSKYKIRESVETDAMKKGNMTEEKGFTIISTVLGYWLEKNTERKSNGLFSGEIDTELPELIIDNKSSWSYITFLENKISNLKDIYWWQGQGYCELWNKPKAMFCFTLNNTPDIIIADMKKRLWWKMGCIDGAVNQDYMEACEQIDRNGIFDHLSDEERLIMVQIERDKVKMQWMMDERIPECRQFIKENIEVVPDIIEYKKNFKLPIVGK